MTSAITTLALLSALLYTAASSSTTNTVTANSKGINPVQHSE